MTFCHCLSMISLVCANSKLWKNSVITIYFPFHNGTFLKWLKFLISATISWNTLPRLDANSIIIIVQFITLKFYLLMILFFTVSHNDTVQRNKLRKKYYEECNMLSHVLLAENVHGLCSGNHKYRRHL